ncbi:MAG: cupin domain-containing protein [Candidatus Latescibacterota bacterium]
MKVRRVSGESVVLPTVQDGPWSGSKLAEIFPVSGDTRMSCGVHEMFASEVVVENAPVDDVLVVLEGELEIEAGGVTETYRAGDFAYLYAGERQKFIVRDRVKHVYVTYPRNWTEAAQE